LAVSSKREQLSRWDGKPWLLRHDANSVQLHTDAARPGSRHVVLFSFPEQPPPTNNRLDEGGMGNRAGSAPISSDLGKGQALGYMGPQHVCFALWRETDSYLTLFYPMVKTRIRKAMLWDSNLIEREGGWFSDELVIWREWACLKGRLSRVSSDIYMSKPWPR